MAEKTEISYCDSTVNAMMGCDGCELNRPGEKHCYAEAMTNIYAGQKGWPDAFDKPKIFEKRISVACAWSDLRGKTRGYIPARLPRLIFLNDMGDTFTKSLPRDWLVDYVGEMVLSGHIWLILTKRPNRMAEFFFDLGYVPDCFWVGTSITTRATYPRIDALRTINAKTKYLSIEPMLEPMPDIDLTGIAWAIVGAESGANYRHFEWDSAREILHKCRETGTAFFMKQGPGGTKDLPADLQIREFPV